MPQWSQAFAAPAEDLGPVLSPHGTNANSRAFSPLFWLPQAPGLHVVHSHTCKQNSHTHERNELIFETCLFVLKLFHCKTEDRDSQKLIFYVFLCSKIEIIESKHIVLVSRLLLELLIELKLSITGFNFLFHLLKVLQLFQHSDCFLFSLRNYNGQQAKYTLKTFFSIEY